MSFVNYYFTPFTMLTDEQIGQFQEVYRKRYNKEISKEDAYDQAVKLIAVVRSMSQPMTLKEYDSYQRHRIRIFFRHVGRAFVQYRKDRGKDRPQEL